MKIMTERLETAFALFCELAEFLDESALESKLAGIPSNTVGQQLWCVIGARESYTRAISKGQWTGFSCSLAKENIGNKEAVLQILRQSSNNALSTLGQLKELSENQTRLAFQLLEHEVQHHGQLIRYLYALKVGIPKGWKERYHLD